MIAGIGCKRGVSAADVLAAIDAALAAQGASRPELEALAVLAQKASEDGVTQSARLLGLPLRVVEMDNDVTTPTRSSRSLAATGQGSASEAAALAAAGEGGRLRGARTVVGSVACALSERSGA